MGNQEVNWTELLEREYSDPVSLQVIAGQRASGISDKETYLLLESFG